MSDLKFENDKLVLINGDLALASPIEEARQRNLQHFRFILGEWEFADDEGIPYFTYIFSKNIPTSEIESFLRREILRIPGNKEIVRFDFDLDRAKGTLTLRYQVLASAGLVTIETEENNSL